MTDKQYGWPTTRRFPNTLAEAFPNDAERAEWFHPPEKRRGWGNAVMLIAGLMLWCALGWLLLKGAA